MSIFYDFLFRFLAFRLSRKPKAILLLCSVVVITNM